MDCSFFSWELNLRVQGAAEWQSQGEPLAERARARYRERSDRAVIAGQRAGETGQWRQGWFWTGATTPPLQIRG